MRVLLAGARRTFFLPKGKMQTLTEPAMKAKPFEAGDGIEFKILDDKILISAQGTTRIREGNFLLQGKEIIIEAGKGIKISSRTPNVLVIEANTTKQDEIIYDLKKQWMN